MITSEKIHPTEITESVRSNNLPVVGQQGLISGLNPMFCSLCFIANGVFLSLITRSRENIAHHLVSLNEDEEEIFVARFFSLLHISQLLPLMPQATKEPLSNTNLSSLNDFKQYEIRPSSS